MKTATKVLATVTTIAGLIIQFAPAIQAWISAHPAAFSGAGAIALLTALFHNPIKTS